MFRWASLKRPQERAKRLAKLVDCKEGEEMDKMVACLRDTPMFQLMNTHPNFYAWKHLQQTQEPVTAWSPRVDPEAGMSFMPNEPIDLMTSGNFQHVPWITGITDDEGATRSYAFFEDMAGVREWEEKFAELGPLVFGLHDGQSEAPKVSNFNFWFSLASCNSGVVGNPCSSSFHASSHRRKVTHFLPIDCTMPRYFNAIQNSMLRFA